MKIDIQRGSETFPGLAARASALKVENRPRAGGAARGTGGQVNAKMKTIPLLRAAVVSILLKQVCLKAVPVPVAMSWHHDGKDNVNEAARGWSSSKKRFRKLPVSRLSTIRPFRVNPREVKEEIRVVARAPGMYVRSWEERDVDGFERICCVKKQAPVWTLTWPARWANACD